MGFDNKQSRKYCSVFNNLYNCKVFHKYTLIQILEIVYILMITKLNTFRRSRNNKTLRTSFSLNQNVKRIYLASFVDRLRPLDVAFPRGAPFMSP